MNTDIANKKAVIFMATYNGEKYIRQQLDSILNQTYCCWNLIISDDGSTDKTLEILLEYKQRDSRIIGIINNKGTHGAFANFYNAMRWLLSKEQNLYRYFFYCDQDDIWLPQKIEKEIYALNNTEKSNCGKPIVCYSDLQIMNADGNSTGKRLTDFTDIKLDNPYNLFFSERYIWGTTMAHNLTLWDKMELPNNIPSNVSHDNYLPKYAALFGKIVYINEPLVHYRRHGHNVSGVPHSYGAIEGAKRAMLKMPQVVRNHARTYKATLFLDHMKNYNDNDFTIELRECLQNGGWNAIRFLKSIIFALQIIITTRPRYI